MKVLMVEPGKAPYEKDLAGGLKPMQEAVGGMIQCIYPFHERAALVCNDEGKILGLPLNRAVYNDDGQLVDVISGNFFIAGLGEEELTDLPQPLMQRYAQRFRQPEQFLMLNGQLVVLNAPEEKPQSKQPQHKKEPGHTSR